jgi:cold shock protein
VTQPFGLTLESGGKKRFRFQETESEKGKEKMQKGTVKFFNTAKGFGFITPEGGGKDVFVHANDTGGAILQEGSKVEFDVVEGKKGPQASGVKLV